MEFESNVDIIREYGLNTAFPRTRSRIMSAE